MTQALDYSLARPDPAAIVAAGYIGVLRYLAPLPADAAKVITAAEYAALQAAGLKVALNWEWYGNRAREGAAAGTADAQEALRQADELGYHGAIYFSVDYDAPESDQPALDAYFQACAQVLGLHRVGAYAGYWPLTRLLNAGLVTYGWQTFAWSGGNKDSRIYLYQNGTRVFNGGADVNDILKENWTGETMVPDGWTDDGTTLRSPNGQSVVGQFRAFVLGYPGGWDRGDEPLVAEHAQVPMELSNPSVANGIQQEFAKSVLELEGTPGATVFKMWCGGEILALRKALAAQPPTGTAKLVISESAITAVIA